MWKISVSKLKWLCKNLELRIKFDILFQNIYVYYDENCTGENNCSKIFVEVLSIFYRFFTHGLYTNIL